MMNTQPEKQHEWLHRLVGDWVHESEVAMPGQPAEKFTGTETVRSLGGLWILAEGQGPMPGGGEAKTLMTLGYDPQKGRFAGTWIGSMMTHLWVYDGELDVDKSTLSLYSEGPDMAVEGAMAKYKETIELASDDHRIFTSHTLSDGEWTPFMTVHYRRKQ